MFSLYHFFAYNSIKIQDFFEIYRARILKRISIIFLPDSRHPSPSPLPSHPLYPPEETLYLTRNFPKNRYTSAFSQIHCRRIFHSAAFIALR